MEPRPIRFVHRGRVQQVSGVSPTLSVLDWLRENARCKGSKEGCAEGDCGACTVIVAELPDADSRQAGPLTLRPINACIRFLPTLDGKALLTVEDLAQGSSLHPVQQALVECHGSQCGFCTPGFAMSLTASYEQHLSEGTRPDRQALADALAGNLCRCTGYRPILDAGQRMFELPEKRFDLQALAAQLQTLRADAPLTYEGPQADGSGRAQTLHVPLDIPALASLKAAKPEARLLAGSTDIGLWVNKQFRDLGPDILYLGDIAELRRIRALPDGGLQIGAAVTLEDGWSALVQRWPFLRELWLRFAGPPVRHAGTLVGNLANGSPIGDSAPALMAMDATLLLRCGEQTRELPLDEFYVDYMKNRLEPGEWLQAVTVPAQPPLRQLRAWKISKRFDCDISALCGAFALELDGQRIHDVRLVFGGLAATVKRASAAEAALRGQPWSQATLLTAQAALDQDFQPLSDLRASADYRREAARGLLRRLWLQTREQAPLSDALSSVWHREASA